MTPEQARGIAIAELTEAFSVKDMTSAKVRLYDQALEKVPVPLLKPMVRRAVTTRQWFPKVAELLADAEAVRLEMVQALGPYNGCAQCEDMRGWVAVTEADGVLRLHRCHCWRALQGRLAALGVRASPLALPVGAGQRLVQRF